METLQTLQNPRDMLDNLAKPMDDITQVSQRLDTWRGVASSKWTHAPTGIGVEAQTVVDMASSTISLDVATSEPGMGVSLAFAFPAGSVGSFGCRDFKLETC